MDDKIYTRNKLRLPKIPSKFQNSNTQEKVKKCFNILLILGIAFAVVYFSVQAIEPIMKKQCVSMAKGIATKIANNEATKVMKKYSYEDLLMITKDDAGNIKMVGTNIVTVNEIISDIPVNIQQALEQSENNSFNIRLGSFLGSKLFARKRTKC